jgi:hypothetical protein
MATTPKRIIVDEWKAWWYAMAETCTRMAAKGGEVIGLAAMVQTTACVGGSSSRSSDVARPTELSAIAALYTRCPRCSSADHEHLVDREAGGCADCGWVVPIEDLVAVWLADLFRATAEMREISRKVDRLDHLIDHRADGRVGRQSSLQGPCVACGRVVAGTEQDRLRSSLCDPCRKRWKRWASDREDGSVSSYLAWLDHQARRSTDSGTCPRPTCRQPLSGETCPRCGFDVSTSSTVELHA